MRVYAQMSDFVDPGPADIFVFLDERSDSINDGEFAVEMTGYPDKPQDYWMLNWPSTYHNGAATLSFADGHSEKKKWTDARTLRRLSDTELSGQQFRAFREPSPHNPDVAWLQDHATRPLQ